MPSFGLFLLVLSVLFVRPAELVPGLEGAPIYEVLIAVSLAAAANSLVGQVFTDLAARPVTAFVVALLPAIVCSLLAQGMFGPASEAGIRFAKIVLLYLLLVATVRTVDRLRGFMLAIGVLSACQAGLGLLQYCGYIDVPSLRPFSQREIDALTGASTSLPRLCGAGIFHDPNDLCVLLAIGNIITLYLLNDRRLGSVRFAAAIPFGVFAVCVPLTHSRGGLLALFAGLAVLLGTRLGTRRGLLVLGLLLPPLLVAIGGRMTRFELDNPEDTSQHRIRLWSDGLQLFRESPLFGIGQGEYAGHAGQVAHNSYIEAYTELGFVGGTCFLGLFAYTGLALWRLRRFNAALDPALRRLHPYLFAILATLAVGFTSLSRVYTPTTYVLFGLFAAYLRLAARQVPKSVPHLTATLVVRLAALSALSLVTLHVITTTMVRWT